MLMFPIIHNIINEYHNNASFIDIVINNVNVFVVLGILLLSGIIKVLKKRISS